MTECKCPKCGAVLTITAKQQNKATLDSVKQAFPEDLQAKLNFIDETAAVIVKPKQFLGQNSFKKTAALVRGLSGEYVSAGKDSHFKIPK
jgi:hypothetical protein